ncbi:MAG: glycosyltransferase family 39 protein, partial [Chloroflexi bacterium]|nr:glycosyltransferase family 39 protein [Chloroflexota bacterium]
MNDRLLREHGRFFLLLIVFIAGSLVHARSLAAMEGSDEPLHFNYALHLYTHNQLPDRDTYRTNSTRQASGQPPLAYWITAQILRLIDAPHFDGDAVWTHTQVTVRNRWYWPHDPVRRGDNQNVYLHGRDEIAFAWPELVAALRAARIVSVGFGVLTVIGLYGAAREVFEQQSWALTATAIGALLPTMLHLSSYVTNDSAAVAFASLATWQTLALLKRGSTVWRWLLIGALLGLAGLAKINALLIAPGVGVALLIDWRAHGGRLPRLLRDGLLIGLPLTVILGPWLLWGLVNYGDPLGINTHQHADAWLFAADPQPLRATLAQLPHLYTSYWAQLATVPLTTATYAVFTLIAGLALLGYGVGIRRIDWRAQGWQIALVLGVIALGAFAGMFRWMQQLAFTGGRLLYPAHVAIMIGVVGGLVLLGRRFPRWDRR